MQSRLVTTWRTRPHVTSARQDAVPGRTELAEELLVAVGREPGLHRVQVFLVERELRAGEAGRATSPRPAAGLRAESTARPLCREAGEAVALAGAQIEILAPGLRDQLRADRVLHVTRRPQIAARAGGGQQDCQQHDWAQDGHGEGKLVPSPAAARGC